MTRDEYREVYLRSTHWLEVRKGALDRAGHHCQVCNGAKNLDVHHRTYERLGEERDADLTVLCRGCHDLFHSSKPKKRRTKKTKGRKQATKAEPVVGIYCQPPPRKSATTRCAPRSSIIAARSRAERRRHRQELEQRLAAERATGRDWRTESTLPRKTA